MQQPFEECLFVHFSNIVVLHYIVLHLNKNYKAFIIKLSF